MGSASHADLPPRLPPCLLSRHLPTQILSATSSAAMIHAAAHHHGASLLGWSCPQAVPGACMHQRPHQHSADCIPVPVVRGGHACMYIHMCACSFACMRSCTDAPMAQTVIYGMASCHCFRKRASVCKHVHLVQHTCPCTCAILAQGQAPRLPA